MPSEYEPSASERAWFEQARREGTSAAEALAFFDTLAPVTIGELLGRWRGSGFPTHHRFDGLLEEMGWYGKEFIDPETAFPLLFDGGSRGLFAIDPGFIPVKWLAKMDLRRLGAARRAFRAGRRLLKTAQPTARLRMVEYRGRLSAAMIYDAQPICDVFRKVDSDTLLGAMDLRGMNEPFFFVLERVKGRGN